jgi:hypothetical protein
MAVKKRFWTLLARREGRFLPEFGSFARGDAELAAITKDVEALNDA